MFKTQHFFYGSILKGERVFNSSLFPFRSQNDIFVNIFQINECLMELNFIHLFLLLDISAKVEHYRKLIKKNINDS